MASFNRLFFPFSLALLAACVSSPPNGDSPVQSFSVVMDGRDASAASQGGQAVAGTVHSFHFQVKAGRMGLPAGAVAELVVPATFTPPQTGAPRSLGWSQVLMPSGASLPAKVWMESGDHSLHGTESHSLRTTLTTPLGEGEVLEFVYGDTSRGSPGARVSSLARSTLSFSIRVDATGDGEFEGIQQIPFLTEAGPARLVRAYPPSTSLPGEEVEVKAAAFDGMGNPAILDGAASLKCAWYQGDSLSSPFQMPLSGRALEGTTAAARVTAPSRPGPHWLRCVLDGVPVRVHGATVVAEPPDGMAEAVAPPASSRYLLWGDLHIHSNESDDAEGASLSPNDLYDFARYSAGLDFASVSDHDYLGLETQSAFVASAIGSTNDKYVDGSFVTLLSWEWTDVTPGELQLEGGHKIVYMLQGNGDFYCRSTNNPSATCQSVDVAKMYHSRSPSYDTSCELWTKLAQQVTTTNPKLQAFTIPHHVAALTAPAFTKWDTTPDECGGTPAPTRGMMPVVELYSDHGSNEGWNGEMPDVIEDPIECNAEPSRTVQAALEYEWSATGDQAQYLGIIASGDSHAGRPGLDPLPYSADSQNGPGTSGSGVGCPGNPVDDIRWREMGLAAVWVTAASAEDARDRARVYESLKGRRTYGTTGSRITVGFQLYDKAGVGAAVYIDQGGTNLTVAENITPGLYNDPQYNITGAGTRTTRLKVDGICPGTEDTALQSVKVIRGHGTPGGGDWNWQTVQEWTAFNPSTGCLDSKVLALISAGAVNGSALAEGKNIYYLKVQEVPVSPLRIGSGRNILRLGPDVASAQPCTLSAMDSLPQDYAPTLAADLNACSMANGWGLTFSAGYDSVYNAEFETDFRLSIAADGPFGMDLDTSGTDLNAEATASMLGFALADREGSSSYASDDQVQNVENAEFAWSSPIWVSFTP